MKSLLLLSASFDDQVMNTAVKRIFSEKVGSHTDH